MGTNRVRFHFIFSFELAAHSWQRVTNGEEAPDTRSCGRNGPYETRREQVLSSSHPLSMPMLNPLHASTDPGRLAGKGFAAARRGCEVRHKAVDHGGNATCGLFAFLSVDIAQLKSTSVVTIVCSGKGWIRRRFLLAVNFETQPKMSRRNETRRDETRRNETRRNETRRDETRRDETRRDEARRDKARRDETRKINDT
ncbi:hypothetical protein G5I_07730 [Acromyrmex echinatior]|uniref:Uncharacterized protein n=1 Tax=Acromyrmex echinatior TaxID=103372 RepID=F4WPL1_ACREC|nr:hypothetical protein G5I_07730 [Acromyrmex echinatior]